MKKRIKKLLSRLLICSLIMCVLYVDNVQAIVTNGITKTVNVMGYTYRFCSIAHVDSEKMARAVTDVSSDGNKPAGYIGVDARLYTSDGVLRTSSGWIYTDGECSGMSRGSSYVNDKNTFYSKGQVKIYNGNGYNTYICNSSPNVQTYSIMQYPTNAKGETYGSDYYSTCEYDSPDLILVEGMEGNTGYVKYEDLNRGGECSTLNAAIEYQKDISVQKEIPVYLEDGGTIIDSFAIKQK